jgi:hypothetical protein
MTLIIAGHNMSQSLSDKTVKALFAGEIDSENRDKDTPEVSEPETEAVADGLFFAADSAITDIENNKAILGGFKKIYYVKARARRPYFHNQYFKGYFETDSETDFALAFAGNTLTAQHVLNFIVEHVGNLKVSYIRTGYNQPGTYTLVQHCEFNPLEHNPDDQWGYDMFLRTHTQGLLTAEVIAATVEHSINAALKSAKKYKLDRAGINRMHTDFLAGIKCPASGEYKLYEYRFQFAVRDGSAEVFTVKKEIPPGGLIVLGMRERFESSAVQAFAESITTKKNSAEAMFMFLNRAIDEVSSDASFEIDRPSVLHVLNWKGLHKAAWQNKSDL